MTNAIGNNFATTESRPPILITGKRLNDVLDARDGAMVQTFDRFKVEVVQRQQAIEQLQEQMQNLLVQAMGVIKVNNLLQPAAESVEVRYFVENQGFEQETTQQIATERAMRGGVAWRDVSIRERYEVDLDRVRDAETVVAQLRDAVA